MLQESLNLLGLTSLPDDPADIQSAFRETVLKNHPDKNKNGSTVDVAKIREARDWLLDYQKSPVQLKDPLFIIATLFANYCGVDDIEVNVDVSFHDLYISKAKTVEISVSRAVCVNGVYEKQNERVKILVPLCVPEKSATRTVFSGQGDDPPCIFFTLSKESAAKLRGDIVVNLHYSLRHTALLSDNREVTYDVDRVMHSMDMNVSMSISLYEYYYGLSLDMPLPDGTEHHIFLPKMIKEGDRCIHVIKGKGLRRKGDLYLFMSIEIRDDIDLENDRIKSAIKMLS